MSDVYKDPRTPLPQEGSEAEHYKELVAYIKTKPRRESSSSMLCIEHKIYSVMYPDGTALIGEMLDIPTSKVYGVLTFYSYFTEKPKGVYGISICLGTACYVKGAQKILETFEEQFRLKATIPLKMVGLRLCQRDVWVTAATPPSSLLMRMSGHR